MNELSRCPFGHDAVHHLPDENDSRDFYCCSDNYCALRRKAFTFEEWQTRPLEDALQKQVDDLKATEKWVRGLLNKSQKAGKSLRQSLKEAAAEIEEEVNKINAMKHPMILQVQRKIAIGECLNILRAHRLVEEK